MKQTEKELIWAYIVNQEGRLEAEVVELQNRIRFRRININDCVELELCLQRLDDFREFALTVIRLLNLDNRDI